MVKKGKKGAAAQAMEMQPAVAEFIGSDLQPQPDAPRPKTTPYATSPVALRIGPQQTRYYVPRRLLQNPQWIAFDDSWGNEIELSDVNECTGHVIIHYLYTGAYQTLDDIELSPAEVMRIEFSRAVMAYIAAKKYMLHGLQRLAGQQISTFGAEMSIFDVVEAINTDFVKLPDDATWFHEYMGDKARMAFEQDPTVFARNDLFSRIENVALIRVLAKIMVEVYTNKLSPVLSQTERPTSETPGGCVVDERDLPSEEPPQVECVNINEAPAEECQAEAFTNEEIPIKAALAQQTLVQTPPGIGTVLVDNGPTFSPSKPPKKKVKKGLATFATSAVVEPKPMPIVKKKKKKEPGASAEVSPAELEPIPQPVLEAEPAVVKEDDVSPDAGVPIPIKKKKGKKHAIVGIEEGTKAEDAPPLPVEYPTPVEGECIDVQPVIEESLLSPPLKHVRETEPGPVLEPELVAKKKKKSKKASIPPPLPVPEPEPESEQVIEEPTVDPFAGMSKSQKKKAMDKSKKDAWVKDEMQSLAAVAAADEGPSPSPHLAPPIESQDPHVPELAVSATMEPESAQAEATTEVATNGVDIHLSNGQVSPPEDPDPSIDADKNYCPRRGKHIAKGDRWKTCEQCRAFLCDLAGQLVRESSPIETEYEIVDRASNVS
ncbi:hypothetical protein BKA63DRAFT_561818 [Paraphoma chrysanthemicola]|nr:hypothetical protein BKA63DRAFT_561818 [Paraphoma chrysanthemicola]